MSPIEEAMLLLCCRLGDPDCKPLTLPQFWELGQRVLPALAGEDPLRQLTAKDLTGLGYEEASAEHILRLLDRDEQLVAYLRRGEKQNIHPITRISDNYPFQLRAKLKQKTPAVLFYRGDPCFWEKNAVAVVGSRQLKPENKAFAEKLGAYLAKNDLILVSGGAMGADRVAQDACLSSGGRAMIFVADRLTDHPQDNAVLQCSADGYDIPFANYRALDRNKLIHAQAEITVAVQCSHGTGGTWQGCTENLKHKWSKLFVFDDGSSAMHDLMQQGANPITNPTEI